MDPQILGAAQPYILSDVQSIATGLDNQFAYSPYFVGQKLIASARIDMSGQRWRDYERAEKETQMFHVRRVTVWHHVYDYNDQDDTCTMQLVQYSHHQETIPHAGACIAYAKRHKKPYQGLSPAWQGAVPDVQAYSAKELEEFSLQTSLGLSPALRRFYSGDFRLDPKALSHAAGQDFLLDCVLPLRDETGASMEQVHRALAGKLPVFAKARAIGMDAFGNYFCAGADDGILFYDHEQDQCFETGLSLRELMD